MRLKRRVVVISTPAWLSGDAVGHDVEGMARALLSSGDRVLVYSPFHYADAYSSWRIDEATVTEVLRDPETVRDLVNAGAVPVADGNHSSRPGVDGTQVTFHEVPDSINALLPSHPPLVSMRRKISAFTLNWEQQFSADTNGPAGPLWGIQ